MTAGLGSRPLAGTKVALAPAALVGLLGAALLAGSLLGFAATSELDSINSNRAMARVAAPAASLESQSFTRRNAQIAVGRGPLVRDDGLSTSVSQVAPHVADHIGLTERLFPIGATHVLEHGPVR